MPLHSQDLDTLEVIMNACMLVITVRFIGPGAGVVQQVDRNAHSVPAQEFAQAPTQDKQQH